jgi:hypothetical protein
MEAVFRPEIFRTFSDDFRRVPAGTHKKLTGIHRKKSENFPTGILLPVPGISAVFQQDLALFSGRNLQLVSILNICLFERDESIMSCIMYIGSK